jgi:hypothetical protein
MKDGGINYSNAGVYEMQFFATAGDWITGTRRGCPCDPIIIIAAILTDAERSANAGAMKYKCRFSSIFAFTDKYV